MSPCQGLVESSILSGRTNTKRRPLGRFFVFVLLEYCGCVHSTWRIRWRSNVYERVMYYGSYEQSELESVRTIFPIKLIKNVVSLVTCARQVLTIINLLVVTYETQLP